MGKAFLGAYWGSRAESVDQCAERIARLIPALGAINDRLTGWRDEADSQPNSVAQSVVTTARQDIVERLEKGIVRDDNGKVMETLGYSVHWQTGSDNTRITLNMSLGVTSKWVPNSVVFRFPDPTLAPSIYSAGSASALISTVIDIFQPVQAVWLDDDSHAAQKEPDRVSPIGGIAIGKLVGHPAGWATYLADSDPKGFDKNLLPAEALVQRVGDGTLVLLGDDPGNPPLDDVLQVRRAMGYEVPAQRPQPTAPPSAPMTSMTRTAPGSAPQSSERRTQE
jgi:hypothetical protein